MGLFFSYKVGDNYLYYTSKCFIECFHAHASKDGKLRRKNSAKFWIDESGNTKLVDRGRLKNHEITELQDFRKENYKGMYALWVAKGGKPEFKKKL